MTASHDHAGMGQLAGFLQIDYAADDRSKIQAKLMEIDINVAGVDEPQSFAVVQRIPVCVTIGAVLPKAPVRIDADVRILFKLGPERWKPSFQLAGADRH